MTYEILHGKKLAASITLQGECEIYEARFMPCNLYLEQTDELDGRVNNVTNFYYWCATRVLSLDRKYAKEILNSMGAGSGRVLSFEGRRSGGGGAGAFGKSDLPLLSM